MMLSAVDTEQKRVLLEANPPGVGGVVGIFRDFLLLLLLTQRPMGDTSLHQSLPWPWQHR
jgi:hypothetical protein